MVITRTLKDGTKMIYSSNANLLSEKTEYRNYQYDVEISETDFNILCDNLDSGDIDHYDINKVFAIVEHTGDSIEEAINRREAYEFYDVDTLEDLAEQLVDDGIWGNVNDTLKGYINFERLGNDLEYDGYEETNFGIIRAL
ncbi:MAG: antirestriction protein ArdA [Ruminococcus sp.]|nr:antirestriction protein ArdA [Ruminococcus sp.]